MNWYSLICVLVAQNCGQQIVRLDHHSERLIVVVRLLYARSCTAFCRSCDARPKATLKQSILLCGALAVRVQGNDWLSDGIHSDSVWIEGYRGGHTAADLRFEHRREEFLSQVLLPNVLLLLIRANRLLLPHLLCSSCRMGALGRARADWFRAGIVLSAANLSLVFHLGQITSLTVPARVCVPSHRYRIVVNVAPSHIIVTILLIFGHDDSASSPSRSRY